jgi:hypothetical protein
VEFEFAGLGKGLLRLARLPIEGGPHEEEIGFTFIFGVVGLAINRFKLFDFALFFLKRYCTVPLT